MRNLLAILILLSLQLSAQDEVIIDETFQNKSLEEVFHTLKERYGVRIAYSKKNVIGKTVTVDIRKETLTKAVEMILKSSGLDFELVDNRTVIIKSARTSKTQSYDFSGKVVDPTTGEALPFAHLIAQEQGISATTNEYGYFTLAGLTDNANVQVSFVGYRPVNQLVTPEMATENFKIQLTRDDQLLEEIQITDGVIESISSEAVGRVTFDPEMVKSVPTTAEKDLMRMTHLLPGVNATNELSSGIEIQGGTSSQNVVIFDGFTIYHLDHFFGYFSSINPYSVKSMRLMKSGYGAKYGGGSSGVLEFVGKDGNRNEVSGKLSISELSINSSLEVPISESTSLFASARRSYSDLVRTSLFNRVFGEYEEQLDDSDQYQTVVPASSYDPEFHYDDLNFKISSFLSDRTKLELSVYNSSDLLTYDQSFNLGYPQDSLVLFENLGQVNWGNIGASTKLGRYWNSSHFTELYVSYSKYSSDYQESSMQFQVSPPNAPEQFSEPLGSQSNVQENHIEDISFDAEHEWNVGSTLIELGSQNTLYGAFVSNEFNDESITDKRQKTIGLFTQYINASIQFRAKSRLGLGLRNNYLTSQKQILPEPRISFEQDFSEYLTFRAGGGVFRQFVNQVRTDNALQGSRDLWVISDKEIPDQSALHFYTGFIRSKGFTTLELNYFQRRYTGLLDYAFTHGGLVTEYVNYEELFFEGEGKSKGIEAAVRVETNRFLGSASYTLSSTRYKFDDLNNGKWYYADIDQRHEATLFGTVKLKPFNVFSTVYMGSGRPYSQFSIPQALRGPGNNDGPPPPPNDIALITTDGKNDDRLAVYNRVDLGASYNRQIGNLEMTFSMNLFNVFDRENQYDRKIKYEVVRVPPPPGGGPPPRPVLTAKNYDVILMGRTLSFMVELEF